MCGIWGISYGSNREEWTTTELAQLLFPETGHRGPHAFGWMTWDGSGTPTVVKHIGDVRQVRNLEKVELDDNAKWVIGHVRYATNGSPSYMNNNHPIEHGDIVGVHNGRIHNFTDILKETGRTDDMAEVDSEAIFAAVNRWGHRAGLRKIEGNLATAYTRVSRPSSIYIARSTDRYTLWFGRTPAGNLVFASELAILRSVFGRSLTHVRQLKPYHMLRIVDGKVIETEEYMEPPPPPPPPPVYRPSERVLRPIERRPVSRGNVDLSRWRNVPGAGILHELANMSPLSTTPVTDEFARRMNARLDDTKKSKKRGRKNRQAITPRGYHDGDEVRPGTFYYNGLLLTEDDYINAIADEVGWGDD